MNGVWTWFWPENNYLLLLISEKLLHPGQERAMNPWQATLFGLTQIQWDLTDFEIGAFFTFTAAERQVIEQRRRLALRLGLALQ